MATSVVPVENVFDGDTVLRLVFYPAMYASNAEYRFDLDLQFPSSDPHESFVWAKFFPSPDSVQTLGCAEEVRRRERRPNARYKGYFSALVGRIRSIRNSIGDRFVVEHAPVEGQHHIAVRFSLVEGTDMLKLRKNDLKLALSNLLQPLTPQTCE